METRESRVMWENGVLQHPPLQDTQSPAARRSRTFRGLVERQTGEEKAPG